MNNTLIKCAHCAKPIRKDAPAVSLPESRNQLLHHECFHQTQSTINLHHTLYPHCKKDWHDMNDHRYVSATAEKLIGWISQQEPASQLESYGRARGAYFDSGELLSTTFPNHATARDILTANECTAPCLLALNIDTTCQCVCGERYHGLLTDAPIDTRIDNMKAV